jgi:hypothetical protein
MDDSLYKYYVVHYSPLLVSKVYLIYTSFWVLVLLPVFIELADVTTYFLGSVHCWNQTQDHIPLDYCAKH